MNRAKQVLVTRDGWGVSTETGSGIKGAILHVYKHHGALHRMPRFISQHGDAYGMTFPNAEAATAYALDHGYLQPYYRKALLGRVAR